MVVPVLIIPDSPFLNTFLGHCHINVNPSVRSLCSGQYPQLHGIQRGPGIPVGRVCQKISCILVNVGIVNAHSPFLVINCPADQLLDIVLFQGLELKYPGPGKKSPIYLKVRIFRSSSNQYQGPVLHKGQKVILLSFIKAVDLIHKQDGFPSIHANVVLGLLHHFLHVLFSCHCGVNLPEIRTGGIGNDLCQGGLTGSRRSVKNNGSQLIRLYGPVQQLILSHNMLLPHHLIQGPWTEPGCQRRLPLHILFSHIIKQIHICILLSQSAVHPP